MEVEAGLLHLEVDVGLLEVEMGLLLVHESGGGSWVVDPRYIYQQLYLPELLERVAVGEILEAPATYRSASILKSSHL